MNTFRCSNCGFQIQRPTQPFSCPQCGRQAVGLFRIIAFTPPQQGGWPGQPAAQQQPGWPQPNLMQPNPMQQGTMQPYPQAGVQPQQGAPQQVPGVWPGQPQVPQPPANPWGQQYPQASQPQQPLAAGGWPGQPGMPPGMPPQQGIPQQGLPQQGGWPMQPQQPAMNPWGQPPTVPQMPQPPVGGGWPGVSQPSAGQWPGSQGRRWRIRLSRGCCSASVVRPTKRGSARPAAALSFSAHATPRLRGLLRRSRRPASRSHQLHRMSPLAEPRFRAPPLSGEAATAAGDRTAACFAGGSATSRRAVRHSSTDVCAAG